MAYGLILPESVRARQPSASTRLAEKYRRARVFLPSTQSAIAYGSGAGIVNGIAGAAYRTENSTLATVSLADSGFLPTGDCVFVIVAEFLTSASVNGEFGLNDGGTGSVVVGAHIPYTDGNIYWDYGGISSGATRLSVAANPALNVVHTFVFSVGPEGMSICQNGVQLASNTARPTRTAVSGYHFLLGRNFGSGSSPRRANYYLAAVLPHGLPLGERLALSRNPWQLFEPDDTPVFYSLASGTSYTDSLSDSAAATDSASTALVALQSESDSAAATDAATASLTLTEAITDSADATETIVGGLASTDALTDSAAATDTVADSASLTDALADSAAGTDTATGEVGAQSYTEAIADSADASDTLAIVQTLTVALADTAAATDDAFAGAQNYTESLTDSAAATDTVASANTLTLAIADTSAATDALGSTASMSEVCADLAAGSDIFVGPLVATIALSDSGAATDQMDGAVGAQSYTYLLTDDIEATDALTRDSDLEVDLPRTRRIGGTVAARNQRIGLSVAGGGRRLGPPVTRE